LGIFVLSLVFVFIIAVETPRLLREKRRREFWAFAAVTLIAMLLSFSVALKLAVTRPVFAAMEQLLMSQ